MCKSKKPDRTAFVLTEILVAVAILGIGLVFVLSSEVRLLQAQQSIVTLQEATALAERFLWEMNYMNLQQKIVPGFAIQTKRISPEGELFQEREVEVAWGQGVSQKKLTIITHRISTE